MTITEWFDIHNPDHLQAHDCLVKEGSWPKDFIDNLPEDITFPPAWNIIIAYKIAEVYTNLHETKGLRTFEHPNTSNDWKCPICKTNTILPVLLVAIPGTEDGNLVQAEQIHVVCLNFTRMMTDIKERQNQ